MKHAPYDGNKVTNTIKGLDVRNVNTSHRRDGNPSSHILVYLKNQKYNGNDHATITVDVFEPKQWKTGMERVTCCVWVTDSRSNTYLSGSDYAGGCGYDKTSAAIDGAVASAGIKLDKRFNGAGRGPTDHAIVAIMSALGYRRNQYIIATR